MSASESDSSTEVSSEKHYRRRRTIITPDQLEQLERAFKLDPWPVRHKKEEIARDLGKTEVFVSTWFQNKRARVRRTEELNLPKPSRSIAKEESVKTVSVEDKKGNKYLKIVRVSPSDAFDDVTKRVVTHDDILAAMDEDQSGGNDGHGTPSASWVSTNVEPLVRDERKDQALKGELLKGQTKCDQAPGMVSKTMSKGVPAGQLKIPAALQQPAHQGYSDTQQGRKRACLFHSIIDMMAVAEGGIIHSSDPEFNSAVSNALYGILINGDSRIIYDKVLGLDIVNLENSDK